MHGITAKFGLLPRPSLGPRNHRRLRDDQGIRRDRRGRLLRWFTDSDAAGADGTTRWSCFTDRATFPSATLRIVTHLVHPLGVAALSRKWGLLDRSDGNPGCPPIHTYAFDFGPFYDRRCAGQRRRRRTPTRSAADHPRQAAGRRGRRSRGGSPWKDSTRRRRRSWMEDGRATGMRRGHFAARRPGHRATRIVVVRRRRQAFDRRRGRSARSVRREAGPARGVLHPLEQPADGGSLGDLHPRQARICRHADP